MPALGESLRQVASDALAGARDDRDRRVHALTLPELLRGVLGKTTDGAIRTVAPRQRLLVGEAHRSAVPILDALLDAHDERDETHRIEEAAFAEQGRGMVHIRGQLDVVLIAQLLHGVDDQRHQLVFHAHGSLLQISHARAGSSSASLRPAAIRAACRSRLTTSNAAWSTSNASCSTAFLRSYGTSIAGKKRISASSSLPRKSEGCRRNESSVPVSRHNRTAARM